MFYALHITYAFTYFYKVFIQHNSNVLIICRQIHQ